MAQQAQSEFYVGKSLPSKLKGPIDSNGASLNAVNLSIANQQQDIERINKNFDDELAHLKTLWARQK